MFAVVAKFADGKLDLIGFANTPEQVDALVGGYVSRHGAEFLGSKGVQFNVELAA